MRTRRASPRFRREAVLAAGAIALILLLAGMLWVRVVEDRKATLAESVALSRSLLTLAEGTWSATLRDAANAAVSAALLIEASDGRLARGPEEVLHRELKRELWDERGAARLVFQTRDGSVRASSADYPVRRGAPVPLPSNAYRLNLTGNRPFFIAPAERSAFGSEYVLPLWCEVGGAEPGWLRTELRVTNLDAIMGPIASLQNGAIAVVDSKTGITVVRVPWRGPADGARPSEEVVRRLGEKANIRESWNFYTSPVDGATRLFAWRRMDEGQLVFARGADEAAILQPVRARTQLHLWLAAVATAAIAVLTFLFAMYLRRSDRLQARAERFEQRFWNSLEQSSSGVVVMAPSGGWQYANPAMCDLLGYSREELLALPSEIHTPPPFREARKRLFEEYQAGRTVSSTSERPLLHKDGREVWVNIHANILEQGEGTPPLVICYVQDVSARHEAEIALQMINRDLEDRVTERTRELEHANANLEAFSYSAAHDLRSPLAMIASYAELLERQGGDAPKASRWVEGIRTQATRMLGLIDSLMSLGRVSRTGIERKPVDLDGKVARLVMEFGERDPEQAARVEWRVGPLPQVMGDRGLLRVVLENLIGNALKYSRHATPPRITIEAFDPGQPGMAGFVVRDNGAGFDMARAEGLFTAFRRMHTVSQFEGHGIGLAIVHRVVERHGGSIRAEARPGEGASFYVTLPAAP